MSTVGIQESLRTVGPGTYAFMLRTLAVEKLDTWLWHDQCELMVLHCLLQVFYRDKPISKDVRSQRFKGKVPRV